MVGQRAPRVRVNYGGRTYTIPGSFSSQQAADEARDLLILLLPHFSQSGPGRKMPGLRNPRDNYYVPGVPGLLAIPQDLLPRLAAALGVSRVHITWEVACMELYTCLYVIIFHPHLICYMSFQ